MPNLLQKASIVLTPTAYNDGEVLCAKPSKPPYGDFDFSRNSAATRVTAQGLVENVQILSGNLVQNPSFSEEGAEEVSNGSFSQESAELVTNGSFDTDTDWVHRTSNSVISNGTLSWSGTQTLADDVYQQKTGYVGKLVKMTINISSYTQGSVFLRAGSSQSPTSHSSVGTFTEILEWVGNDYIYVKASSDFIGSIESVSVREVGQDWVLSGGVSIGSDKAIFNATSQTLLYQNISGTTQGTTYKVTYTISEYISGSIFFGFGNGITSPQGTIRNSDGTYTEYITKSDANISGGFRTSAFIGSITNISVKEVGMGWTLGTGWSIDQANSKATCDGSQTSTSTLQTAQGISNIQNDLVKLSFEIKDYSAGAISSVTLQGTGGIEFSNLAANGVYEINITSSDASPRLLFNANSSFVGSITNISVIEITDDTNLPRINYEGFSYQDDLGSEEIVNGGFDNGTAWILSNSTISNGELNILTASINNTAIQSISGLTVGANYKIEYDINSISNGGLVAYEASHSRPAYETNVGTYSNIFTATATTQTIYIRTSGATTATIDNVSVKEYLGQEVVPNSGCGSWLWEPQSTNTINSSNTVASMNYHGGLTRSDNASISPDSTFNAMIFTPTATGGVHRTGYSNPAGLYAQNDIVTFSGFVKANGYNFVTMGGFFGQEKAVFNISNGTLVSQESNVINTEIVKLTNDWYRVSTTYTFQNGIGNGYLYAGFYVMDTETGYAFTGDGVSGVYGYGFQAELGTGTSYIPTSGSQVTRNKDVCNNGGTGAGLINSTEGVLYWEGAKLQAVPGTQVIGLSDGSGTNRIGFQTSTTANQIIFVVDAGGGQAGSVFVLDDITDYNKLALKWKQDDFSFWVNGIKIGADTSGNVPPLNALDTLDFYYGTGLFNFTAKTKALAVWKEALSDQELADLTYPTPTDPTFSLDFDTIAEQFTFARGSEATYVDAQGLIQSTNEIGEELVVNGGFDTNLNNWVAYSNTLISWESGGYALLNSNNNYWCKIKQSNVFEIGKTYKVVLTAKSNRTDLNFHNSPITGSFSQADTFETFDQYYTATTTDFLFGYSNAGSSTITIDNVSVKEVISATNTPRLDYSTGAEAFLLEPQSTNLVTDSQNYNSTYWSGQRGTLSDGGVGLFYLSPTSNVIKYEATQSQYNQMYCRLPSAVTIGNTYTQQGYVKCDDAPYIHFQIHALSGNPSIVWDNINNVVISSDPSIDSYNITSLSDGWVKAEITYTATAASIYASLKTYFSTSSTQNWAGVTAGTIAYQTFVQVEELPFASSYIPSNGSQTTRNQETCINATPEINSEEGVLYFNTATLVNTQTTDNSITLTDGVNNKLLFRYRGTNEINLKVFVNGVAQTEKTYTLSDATDFNKIAIKWQLNNYKIYVNGVSIFTSGNALVFPNGSITNLSFADGASNFFGNTKDLQVYPKALSDAELIKLTT